MITRDDYFKTMGALRSYTNQFIRPKMKVYKILWMANVQYF